MADITETSGTGIGTDTQATVNENGVLYLHNSDHPGMILVSAPLTGKNYLSWSISMVLALRAKDKLGFIDGSCEMPAASSATMDKWKKAEHKIEKASVNWSSIIQQKRAKYMQNQNPAVNEASCVNSQDLQQDIKLDELETNHFVLVHGGGFGAWCWYKTIALLEEGGFKVTAIDLTGSGVHSFDTNDITNLSQYVKPLTNFFEKLADGEKVILVGHDFGGASISYAMELFPHKTSKAIFVAAAMLTNGQSTLDMFSQEANSNDLMQQAQIFVYANGNGHPPTAIELDKSLLRELLFNQSPAKRLGLPSWLHLNLVALHDYDSLCVKGFVLDGEGTFEVILLRKAELAYLAIWFGINAEGNSTSKRKAHHVFVWAFEFFLTVAHSFLYLLVQDIALASVSMRPIPFAPVLEKLCLSDMKYGTVRRFYIETAEDNAIPITLQESMINSSPRKRFSI
ncbi:hypothetical protein GH714_012681 [Hevea brasiliensis]|uniref:AB hydrolase-1 domain-containing protein n=1 Tax=Hevea brasiliensis TaxID=3981 RepID=A0A6A6MP01_HEVBR|nr:hypothetical protein GH714_012681 [Hevea brasiliensis]